MGLAAGAVGGLPVEVLGPTRLHPRTLRRLREAMGRADVTIAHGSTTLVATGLAGLGRRRPVVYRQISDPAFWTPTWRKRLRTMAFYRFTTHVVALSNITASVLQSRFGLDPGGITVIPNAVDERRCPAADSEDRASARHRLGLPPAPAPVVAYVGALAAEKGVADLIAAVPRETTLVIAGDGEQRDALDAQARRCGGDCRFLGALEDPWDVYASADILVLPSRGGDTQPAVLIEASLVGTAIVTTDVGAITDIVKDGITGVIAKSTDSDALGETIEALLADPATRDRLADAAREHAQAHFSMTVVAKRWVDTLAHSSR